MLTVMGYLNENYCFVHFKLYSVRITFVFRCTNGQPFDLMGLHESFGHPGVLRLVHFVRSP